MQKKPLKVQAARKIYKPKYPSYEDKNPLLYPETRPYPFSHKFIKWASTGGLASLMLFSGNELSAQAQQDSLYNPFPLENARVPYQPVSFGTGMPQRLRSEEARQAIRKAFADSGVELEEKVWLDDGVGVFLDGYSEEDKIGFVYIDYQNMDKTFAKDRFGPKKKLKKGLKLRWSKYTLRSDVKSYKKTRRQEFELFLKDKDAYLSRFTRYNPRPPQQKYAASIKTIEAKKESEALFNKYKLRLDIDTYHARMEQDEDELAVLVSKYIDERFENSIDKVLLFNYARKLRKYKYSTDEYYAAMKDEFQQLKTIKSDKKFIKNFLRMSAFLSYNNDAYQLSRDTEYQKLKLDIMKSYPLKKWNKQLDPLDEYQDRAFVSLKEARRLDRKNKAGKQFIAPISSRDDLTIVSPGSFFIRSSEELMKEEQALREEYNQRNEVPNPILSQKKAELKAAFDEYPWELLNELPEAERDSLQKIKAENMQTIKDKYKEAVKLIKEEEDEAKATFNLKLAELNERQKVWRKENAEEVKMKTMRKLEEEVKIYIKWAKSQMGA